MTLNKLINKLSQVSSFAVSAVGCLPPPKDFFTTCEFDPRRNCLSDNDCPAGVGCCPYGCGKVCRSLDGTIHPTVTFDI